MKPNQVVRVRVNGRIYLARITSIGRKVQLAFINQIPQIDMHRKRVRMFPASSFVEHNKSGVDWTLHIKRR